MSLSQKKTFECVALILLAIFASVVESSVFSILPFHMGQFQLAHILIFYLALTRSWNRLCLLTLFFAYLSSPSSGIPSGIQLATLLWVAYTVKFTSFSLSFESRASFVSLSCFAHCVIKFLFWILMNSFHQAIPIMHVLESLPGSTFGVCLSAYFLYPIFIGWDSYFEHEAEDARDFNPSI